MLYLGFCQLSLRKFFGAFRGFINADKTNTLGD